MTRPCPLVARFGLVSIVVLGSACTSGNDDPRPDETATTVATSQDAAGSATPSDVGGPRTVASGLSGDVAPAHDPDMAREDDWFYVFLTGSGVPILRSQDLIDWKSAGTVFDGPHPEWFDYPWVGPDDGLGAPDVEWFGGRWHLYYHSHEFATNNAITGHASNVTLDPNDPDYEWVDDGEIMASSTDDTYSVLDANAVVDQDGVPWLSFGSFWDGIKIVELDPQTGAPVPGAPFHDLAARDPWILGIEGSSIAYHDGYWYLFVSFGFCCQGADTVYETRVGRSAELTGPYVDNAGTPMLDGGGLQVVSSYDHVRGPGGADAYVDDDGAWLVHHWYDATNDGEETLGVRPLLWGPDGWPIAPDPGFEPAPPNTLDPAAAEGNWTISPYDPTQTATVSIEADGELAADQGTWSLDAETGYVTIDLNENCGPLPGTTHIFIVDASGRTGFGYSDTGAALRAQRVEGDAATTC